QIALPFFHLSFKQFRYNLVFISKHRGWGARFKPSISAVSQKRRCCRRLRLAAFKQPFTVSFSEYEIYIVKNNNHRVPSKHISNTKGCFSKTTVDNGLFFGKVL
ncbi:MAG: hypothetical protein ABFD12_11730, partial [Syntrophorhabdus sp.]